MKSGDRLILKKRSYENYTVVADIGATCVAQDFSYTCLSCHESNDLLDELPKRCDFCGSVNIISYVTVDWEHKNPLYNGQGNGGYVSNFFELQEEKVEIVEPLTNEGRKCCFKCGHPTKQVDGFKMHKYTICPKCKI